MTLPSPWRLILVSRAVASEACWAAWRQGTAAGMPPPWVFFGSPSTLARLEREENRDRCPWVPLTKVWRQAMAPADA